MFIYIKINGGLGNQLFQIFTGISYSKDYNINFILEKKYRIDCQRHTYYHNFLSELKPNLIPENKYKLEFS